MGNWLNWTQLIRHPWVQAGRSAGFDRARSWVARSGEALSDLLFPPCCLVCGEGVASGNERICPMCVEVIGKSSEDLCPRCAKPVPDGTTASERGCALCHAKVLWYQRTICVGIYGDLVRDMVIRMKQSRNESLSIAAGDLLATRVQRCFADQIPDLVTPVPMHWMRRLSRGVNAAELLAERIARSIHRPFTIGLLRCQRRTLKQGTLTPKERRRNVRRAYAISPRRSVKGLHVLLVDDVMTTGATANEVAKTLIRGGAAKVSVAVFARGIGFQ